MRNTLPVLSDKQGAEDATRGLIASAEHLRVEGSDDVEFEGSQLDLLRFFSLLDMPSETFNIVTP